MNNKFEIKSDFSKYKKVFLEENSKLNLISRNDEKFLYEKHIYDSLSFKLFYEKYNQKSNPELLDVGCGGGFPSVPIAIEFPQISVTAIDSIAKKINSVNTLKEKLSINNLTTICARVESLKSKKFDIITSRAVADLDKIIKFSLPVLKSDGFLVAYKSRKAAEEIEAAQSILKQYGAKLVEAINYKLPLDEIYERNLVIIGYSE